jgi:hypothetical protein
MYMGMICQYEIYYRQVFCGVNPDSTFFMDVTVDNRINQTVPIGLSNNLTGHLIQYDCFTQTWTDLGQFNGMQGPPGPTGPPGLGLSYAGSWSSTTTYSKNEFVSQDGGLYVSVIDNNLGNQPDNSSGSWVIMALPGVNGTSFTFLGNWDSTIPYMIQSVVLYTDGALYIAIAANTNSAPPSSLGVNWDLFLPAGIQGNPGNQGPTGAEGLGLFPAGIYNSTLPYFINDFVFYPPTGSSYVSLTDNNVGHEPDLSGSSTYWQILAQEGGPGATGASGNVGPTGANGLSIVGPTGAPGLGLTALGNYSNSTTYSVNQYVYLPSTGSSYVSLQNSNVGNPPNTSPSSWQVLAAEGIVVLFVFVFFSCLFHLLLIYSFLYVYMYM